MTELDMDTVPDGPAIKEARLQRNRLTTIPESLLRLSATSLRMLDMSNNTLQKTYLTTAITLPLLTSLKLSSANVTALSPLLTYLDAPKLSDLDISVNRLSGEFPRLRSYYPKLLTINAADNQFSNLPYSNVAGLSSVNLQNNALSALDPMLGSLSRDLKMLEVRGNLFRVPRWDVLDKGTEVLMKWLKERIPEDQKGVGRDEVDDDDDDMF